MKINSSLSGADAITKLLWMAVLWGLGLYAFVLFQIAIAPDKAILLTFAERLLDGGSFSRDTYDPNPPMSMILFMPDILLSRLSGLPIYYAHYAMGTIWVALSLCLSYLLMRRIPQIDYIERQVFMLAMALNIVVVPNVSFGDREHFIILGLIPFMLAQILITQGIKTPGSIQYPALIFGALGLMIKPHYVVLPAAIFLHRLIKRRSIWPFFRDADVLVLGAVILAYITLLLTVFYDFTTIVLPDILKLYITARNHSVWIESFGFGIIPVIFCTVALMFKMPKEQERILIYGLVIMLLGFIPFIAQGKGYDTHRIPYSVMFYIYCTYAGFIVLDQWLKNRVFAMVSAIVLCAFFSMRLNGVPMIIGLTHERFMSLPLSQALEKHCPKPCSYLFWYDYSDIIHQLALYHKATHGTRFTSTWFIPRHYVEEEAIKNGKKSDWSLEELDALKQKYLLMMREDMERFKPSVIITVKHEGMTDREFFSQDPVFAAEMEKYQPVDKIFFKREIYYPGFILPGREEEKPLEFTILKRNDTAAQE